MKDSTSSTVTNQAPSQAIMDAAETSVSLTPVMKLSNTLHDSTSAIASSTDSSTTTDIVSDSTTSTAPDMPAESFAAEKAFAIPELLEAILLEYAAMYANIHEGNHVLRSPITALYALRRVNKATKAFIEDSDKCRRFMFIDPPVATSAETMHLSGHDRKAKIDTLQPLWWLFHTFDLSHTRYPRTYYAHSNTLGDEVWIMTTRDIGNKIFRSGKFGMDL